MASHPYKGLPANRYWKRAVASQTAFSLSELYTKKFEITLADPIAAAGSCFAQHIARRLKANGYRFLDLEPAPKGFPNHLAMDYGYDMYTARFGNIYTARQLLQLAQRAIEGWIPEEQCFEKGGRYFDLLRPTVEPNGFSSKAEYEAMLKNHLRSVKHMFGHSKLFVFTFGLTEAWVDRRDGTVYPICPGTAAGAFDPEKYAFKNFTMAETLADMQAFIALVRSINPDIKFLFTVSPVPLVATAEERHVMVSTVYSKSVLRAVAGELEAGDPLIDYFPSYEVISGIPTRSMFYESDMRSVHSEGVDLVMKHFFAEHRAHLGEVAQKFQYEEMRDPACDEIFLDK